MKKGGPKQEGKGSKLMKRERVLREGQNTITEPRNKEKNKGKMGGKNERREGKEENNIKEIQRMEPHTHSSTEIRAREIKRGRRAGRIKIGERGEDGKGMSGI